MSTNPLKELAASTEDAPEQATPTLMSAAMEIHSALSLSLTAKGLHRPRPLSWGKRIARTHFDWSRIGEKKWNEILTLGEDNGLWDIDEKRRMVYIQPGSTMSEDEDGAVQEEFRNSSSPSSSSRRGTSSMAGFYRDGGMFGGWKVNSVDDWDGKTYSVIRLPWMDKAIEVPSWLHGRTVYELYDKKVREDLANGTERTNCTSCKSQMDRDSVYPDSHGRIACSACNDKMDPRLIRPEGWVPPERPSRSEIKEPSKVKQGYATPPPSQAKTKSSKTKTKNPHRYEYVEGEDGSAKPKKRRKTPSKKAGATKKLRDSVRKDGKADLMDAEDAITLAVEDQL